MNDFYIIANLKMNKTIAESKSYLNLLNENIRNFNNKIVICPSNISLFHFANEIQGMSLGIQDIDHREQGQGTGSISASQVKDICEFAIVGHSERRETFFENNKTLSEKLKILWKNKMTPIFCIGENQEVRDKGFEAVKKHLNNQLKDSLFENSDWENLLVAYEPIWAIGTGLSASPEQASEVITLIHEIIKEISGGIDIPILYGGSVNEENHLHFQNEEKINGLLIGSACLDPITFSKIINNS
tara:strand:- start:722 stop:1453 length:732 start_codon:yes stop_codon:yes gene_type:complete